MRHTLSKQMALSQPHLPEGARGKPEAMELRKKNQKGGRSSIPGSAADLSEKFGFGARFQSRVQERQRTNRGGGGERDP